MLVAYLLRKAAVRSRGQQRRSTTKQIPESSWIPNISIGEGAATEIYGFIFIAALRRPRLLVLLNKTRFGFDLRATGRR